jgi:hypothetical protein
MVELASDYLEILIPGLQCVGRVLGQIALKMKIKKKSRYDFWELISE